MPVAHLRTARRVWRTVVLATHTPLTRVLPTPQAAATSVIMLSGSAIGAGVIACAETAIDKATPTVAINLSIFFSLICATTRYIPEDVLFSCSSSTSVAG
jgi:hypothetical protein